MGTWRRAPASEVEDGRERWKRWPLGQQMRMLVVEVRGKEEIRWAGCEGVERRRRRDFCDEGHE